MAARPRSLFTFAALLLIPLCPARARAEAAVPEEAVVLIRTTNSLLTSRGSGFVIGDGSWVVTASHVVSVDLGKGRRAYDQTALVYSPWTGRPYEAKVVAVDGVADIALLRLPQAGFPALPVEGLDLKDPKAARDALNERPIRLYGFPLSYGEATVAALARPEHNDSKLTGIRLRGETSLCVLDDCPDVKPGWSGGPLVGMDTGAVVGVFHSLYHEKADDAGLPSGSLTGYLADLLRRAGATDLAGFARVAPPSIPRPAGAGDRMATEMRSMSWNAGGNLAKAEEEQRELLKLDKNDPMAHLEIGRLLLVRKKYEAALVELQLAARLAPKSVLANLYLGKALHLNYDPKGAIAAFKAAVAASPGEVEPQLALAEMQADNEKPDDAEATLRAAVQASPDHPGAVYQLGSLLVRQRKTEEGTKLLKQASELALYDPSLSFIPFGFGRILDIARKFPEAEDQYRRALRTDPDNTYAVYYLAQLLMRTGRVEDAQLQLNAGFRSKKLSDEMLAAFRTLQLKLNEKSGGNEN